MSQMKRLAEDLEEKLGSRIFAGLAEDCTPLHDMARESEAQMRRLLVDIRLQTGCPPDLLMGGCPVCQTTVMMLMPDGEL